MGSEISTPKKTTKKSKVISELQNATGMSKEELKELYDKFMDDNPTGYIEKEDFIRAYIEYSPASEEVGERIFDAYDLDGNGSIDVKDK